MLFNAAMDNWTRCSIAFESLCDGIVLELEGIRHKRQHCIYRRIVSRYHRILSCTSWSHHGAVYVRSFSWPWIAGGVIGGLGGITSAGSKVTEVVMNKKWIMQMQRRQRVLPRNAHMKLNFVMRSWRNLLRTF